MSVAEQPITEKATRNPSAQLALESLAGAVLLLVGIWVILAGMPLVWPLLINEFLSGALLLIVTGCVAFVAGYGLLHLEKQRGLHGLRAGAFVGAVFLYIILRIVLATGYVLERQEFDLTVGAIVMAVVGLGLLFGLYKWFSLPGFGAWLGRLQDSGWFSATVFKGNQGVRIRRVTVIAILLLGFWGIISMISSGVLGADRPNQPNHWLVEMPFTGEERIAQKIPAKDYAKATVVNLKVQKLEKVKKGQELLTVKTSDGTESSVLATMDGKVIKVNDKLQKDATVPDDMLFEIENIRDPVTVPLMYRLNLVMPVLLGILLLWLAWRVVNLPTFADFLIATEAEMNKVSWTTRKRLVQDTIVVLVTMILVTMFLFIVDILWIRLLSWDWIYVLQVDTREAQQKLTEKAQW